MKELNELFWLFFKMGSVTFGGGYAMLPLIQDEIVNKRGWATDEELLNYYAIGQSTPGIIAVNTATFIGYNQKGIIGGIVATLGMISPSIIIITIIASLFSNFRDIVIVQHALNGIGVVVGVLILNAVIKMFKDSVFDITTLILFVVSLLLLVFTNISPIYIIVAAAVIGIIKYKETA